GRSHRRPHEPGARLLVAAGLGLPRLVLDAHRLRRVEGRARHPPHARRAAPPLLARLGPGRLVVAFCARWRSIMMDRHTRFLPLAAALVAMSAPFGHAADPQLGKSPDKDVIAAMTNEEKAAL